MRALHILGIVGLLLPFCRPAALCGQPDSLVAPPAAKQYRPVDSLVAGEDSLPTPGWPITSQWRGNTDHQPRVGIVLSGGGALGMAHIGALKALEEHNIPIDYITGTSAGALVGGMYAAGYNPVEIIQMAREKHDDWLAPGLVVKEEYHLKRSEPDGTFFTVPISLRGKQQTLPSGLMSDAAINYGLVNTLKGSAAAAGHDFDSLYIPFRAVAADIFEKKKVVLSEGSLAFALRASIAVPLFLPPASNFQHKHLFDGGIYDNFPIEPMQNAFKPDYIIGIDVAGPEPIRREIVEEGNFMRQLMTHAIDQDSWHKMPQNSAYIAPDLEGMSASDFNLKNINRAYQRGYEATLASIPQIKSAIGMEVSTSYREARRQAFRQKIPAQQLAKISIHGVSESEKLFIRNILQLQEGDSLNMEHLQRGYNRLRTEGNYTNAFPDLIYEPQLGGYHLHLYLQPSTRFKLRLGGSFFTPTDHQLQVGATYSGVNLVAYQTGVSLMRGSFMNQAKLKGRLFFPFKRPLMLEVENNFMQWELQNNTLSLFSADNRADVNFDALTFSAAIGTPVFWNGKLSVGYRWQNLDDRYFINQTEPNQSLDETSFIGQSLFLNYRRSTLNHKMYPTEGHSLRVAANLSRGDETFDSGNDAFLDRQQDHEWAQLSIYWQRYTAINDWFSLGIGAQVGLSSLRPFHNERSTQLSSPKFLPLQDSPFLFQEDLYSKAFLAPSTTLNLSPWNKLNIRISGHYMQSFQNNVTNSPTDIDNNYLLALDNRNFVGNAGLYYRTAIGPVGAFINYYEKASNSTRLFMHLGYLIFDRHPWQ